MPSEHDVDIDAVADEVLDRLDPGTVIDDKVILSRRQAIGLATGSIGVGALATLGVGEASAANGTTDSSVGQIGAAGDDVDVFVDELYDTGGDEWLDIDDTGDVNAGFGRTWGFDSVSTDELSVSQNLTTAFPSTNQTISNATVTKVALDSTENVDSNVVTFSNTDDSFTIQKSGTYLIKAAVMVDTDSGWSTGDTLNLEVFVNGTSVLSDRSPKVGTTAEQKASEIAKKLSSGDAVDVRVYQSSGASKTVLPNSDRTRVSVGRLG